MPTLAIPDPYGLTSSDALTLARDRDLFPTSLSTREIQEEIAAGIRDRAVFSARTTNARYLAEMKTRIERYLAAGYKGDMATLRVELKRELARLGYTPERGFPGDEALGIPPAAPGSLQDLSSDRRINLILETQLRLMTGKAQRATGLDPLALERYPAWELIRTEDRRIPRDWPRRWTQAGGRLFDGRMIALKQDPVWAAIGDPALFPDALGVDHPPFAFASGMGWQQIDEDDCYDLGVLGATPPAPKDPPDLPDPSDAPSVPTPEDLIPDATASTDGLDKSILRKLKRTLGNVLERAKKITWKWIFSRGETNAPGDGQPCGRSYISRDKKCHKAVDVLSGKDPLTSDLAAEALDKARHHHLFDVVRHWLKKSYLRLNQQPGSKETKQLRDFLARIEPAPLNEPLYRGMRFETRDDLAAFVNKVKAGQWPDSPVNAFSKKVGVAARFAEPRQGDEGRFNAVIKITSSKSGRDMQPLAAVVHPSVEHQSEVVFLAGVKMRLETKILKTEGGLTAVIVGHEE